MVTNDSNHFPSSAARFKQRLVLLSVVALTLFVSLAALQPAYAEAMPEVRNIIYIIGDGTGFVQHQVGRVMKEGPLALDSMEVQSFARNASLDNPVTDSAASGTAHATGERTNNRMVAMRPDGTPIPTIIERAKKVGIATGVVTNDALYGATPATQMAHAKDRGEYETIIEQAVFTTQPDVMLGGGMNTFVAIGGPGRLGQTDYHLVQTRDQLFAWDPANPKKLLGFFASGKMAYAIDRPANQPTLGEMAQVALDTLSQRGDKGFFLMIEDDRMDTASHDNDLRRLAYQSLMFDDAVAVALAFAAENPDTLVIVTADHETGGLTQGAGTITRESLLRSLNRPPRDQLVNQILKAMEDNPEADILTLVEQYAGVGNIESFTHQGTLRSFIGSLVTYDTFYYTRTSHSDAPVPVYAQGPGAHLFEGLEHIADMGQTVIQLLGLNEEGASQ